MATKESTFSFDRTEMQEGDENKLIPSANPASYDSQPLFIKEILRSYGISFETVIPATVVKYDREKGVASVQPLVKKVYQTTDGDKYQTRGEITVPVLRMQHGMFWVDAPLYPGDTGYVVAGHRDGSLAVDGNNRPVLTPKRDALGRDIEARTNNLGPQPPNTYLLHRYENGFFVPCRWGSVAVEEADRDSLVVARLKEKVTELPGGGKRYETGGVEGKVTLEKDGHVRVVNGTGVSVHSDEYRLAEEGETPDKTDADGKKWKKKPSVFIDPTADLEKTDARFREIVAMTKEFDPTTGKQVLVARRYRVLADEGKPEGSKIGGVGEITLKAAGGTNITFNGKLADTGNTFEIGVYYS